MFRRAVVEAVGGYRDPPWAEDYDLWLRLAAAGARFAKVPRVLHRWRDAPGRASRTQPRYSRDAFLRCKAHHLAGGPLAGAPGVVVWGAGITGKRLSRYLDAAGCRTHAFIDIDPAKIGRPRRGDILVHGNDPATLAQLRPWPLVAAVAVPEARQLIRAAASAAGWHEGDDFWCAA
jgi:hypothetical protein